MPATPRTHVIGAGLIGASIGLGLRAAGWDVTIADAAAEAERLAWGIGAGDPLGHEAPELVIVAVRPSATGEVVAEALERWPGAWVTDVASVKAPVLEAARAAGGSARYVGSHPMAGREVSGGLAAQSDLFSARPWVVCAGDAAEEVVETVRSVARTLESDLVEMDASAHDAAVARVSHAPQVVASAAAAALGPLGADDVALAGQGLRDVTRIAGSPPAMWADIARMNHAALVATLDHIIGDLEDVREADDIGEALTDLIARGNLEVERIPGKHGGKTREWRGVTVIVPDEPGQLVRLLQDAASVGANVEDLSIEHSPRQPVGLTTLFVEPASAPPLVEALERAGWTVAAS
ncbi:prephenate dehydrogenase [Demequina zhanjiangensis]|uniref:Prephenate dehydrogenase n=1 Tax=Demequina zhanjiangensis TaxID=3051659 RepID=A0ABT8G220_9MICO|nr:prephenate dehydrogenase [Demequina sp. SYSU T00b26]MDN4473185.1 prephenate dehydrogenase [Demequina sp. SYSU T00b26]